MGIQRKMGITKDVCIKKDVPQFETETRPPVHDEKVVGRNGLNYKNNNSSQIY